MVKRMDRPVAILVGLVGGALVLSLLVPMVTIASREGSVIPALEWFVDTSGVVGALLGCATVGAIARAVRRKHASRAPDRSGGTSTADDVARNA